MKKKTWTIRIVSFAIIITAGILYYQSIGRRPYKDLNAADSVSASVELLPPNETVLLGTEPYVVNTYEKTFSENAFAKNEVCVLVKHYEMSDGTWKTDQHTYQYRLEITGRMNNAAKDSTFVYLSNTEHISFDKAWKAAGFSSNRNDYFDSEVATLVAMK